VPISRYFKGHGRDVMSHMRALYGAKDGERVFYATAAKQLRERRRKRSASKKP
jgi:hypothetical protein